MPSLGLSAIPCMRVASQRGPSNREPCFLFRDRCLVDRLLAARGLLLFFSSPRGWPCAVVALLLLSVCRSGPPGADDFEGCIARGVLAVRAGLWRRVVPSSHGLLPIALWDSLTFADTCRRGKRRLGPGPSCGC